MNHFYELSTIVHICSKDEFEIARIVRKERNPGQEEPHGNLKVRSVNGEQSVVSVAGRWAVQERGSLVSEGT